MITTKFIGPTNLKGSRISVSRGDKRKFYSWCHRLNCEENHREAAKLLLSEGEKVLLSFYHEKLGYIHICGESYTAKYLIERITEAMK